MLLNSKGEAHHGIELIIAFFNSNGEKITWIHADNAQELKGTKVVEIARKNK